MTQKRRKTRKMTAGDTLITRAELQFFARAVDARLAQEIQKLRIELDIGPHGFTYKQDSDAAGMLDQYRFTHTETRAEVVVSGATVRRIAADPSLSLAAHIREKMDRTTVPHIAPLEMARIVEEDEALLEQQRRQAEQAWNASHGVTVPTDSEGDE